MNNNNYYVPTIEEFRDGFRYEYKSDEFLGILEPTEGKYVKATFTGGGGMDGESESEDVYNLINEENVRVKYLDEEDLLELGWSKNNKNKGYSIQKISDWVDGENEVCVVDLLGEGYLNIYTYVGGGFSGNPLSLESQINRIRVKNYNEMEVLMRQLSISPSNIKRYDI